MEEELKQAQVKNSRFLLCIFPITCTTFKDKLKCKQDETFVCFSKAPNDQLNINKFKLAFSLMVLQNPVVFNKGRTNLIAQLVAFPQLCKETKYV